MPTRKRRPVIDRAVKKPTDFVEHIQRGGNANEWLANETAKAARAGETDAARDILQDFVAAIDVRSERAWPQLGPPIHWAYARYLADAFGKILAGEDAALALGVKTSKPGRRPGTARAHDDEALAAALNLLLLNGIKPKQAKLYLKERLGTDVRTIEKANKNFIAYRTYLEHAQRLSATPEERDFAAEVIKVGAKPYAAQITAILAAQKPR